MKLPAPDLVVEVLSKGTAKRDRATSVGGVKFTDYAINGIGEYWIVNPGKQTLEQYSLDPEMEEYEYIGTFDNTQKFTARQVVGFHIPVLALFDEQANLNALSASLSS